MFIAEHAIYWERQPHLELTSAGAKTVTGSSALQILARDRSGPESHYGLWLWRFA
jgi:hypothetical protein